MSTVGSAGLYCYDGGYDVQYRTGAQLYSAFGPAFKVESACVNGKYNEAGLSWQKNTQKPAPIKSTLV